MAAALLALAIPTGARAQTCVDVKIGSDQSYSCLNQTLQHAVEQAQHLAPQTDVAAAAAPAARVGTFNQTATHERMGNAFGHSVISQRPPKPVFAAPLVR